MTYQTKHSTNYGTQTKKASTFVYQGIELMNTFILLESGFYLLLETASKIILEQSIPIVAQYSYQNKN